MNRRSFLKAALLAPLVGFSGILASGNSIAFPYGKPVKYRGCLIRRDRRRDWNCDQIFIFAPNHTHYSVWFEEDNARINRKKYIDSTIDSFERMGRAMG